MDIPTQRIPRFVKDNIDLPCKFPNEFPSISTHLSPLQYFYIYIYIHPNFVRFIANFIAKLPFLFLPVKYCAILFFSPLNFVRSPALTSDLYTELEEIVANIPFSFLIGSLLVTTASQVVRLPLFYQRLTRFVSFTLIYLSPSLATPLIVTFPREEGENRFFFSILPFPLRISIFLRSICVWFSSSSFLEEKTTRERKISVEISNEDGKKKKKRKETFGGFVVESS